MRALACKQRKAKRLKDLEHNLLFLGLPESRCPQLLCRAPVLDLEAAGL